MKKLRLLGFGSLLLTLTMAGQAAQTPASATVPSGATGKCNDGSYTSAAKKWQACGGHKGVQSWFAEGSAKAASASPQTTASAAQTPAPATGSIGTTGAPAVQGAGSMKAKSSGGKPAGAPRAVAPGGGPGLVWVNTDSKVYHCPGSTGYGTTKAGKYMSEADAKAAGARANRNVACSK